MNIVIYWLVPKAILFGFLLDFGDEETPYTFELHLGLIAIGFYGQ